MPQNTPYLQQLNQFRSGRSIHRRTPKIPPSIASSDTTILLPHHSEQKHTTANQPRVESFNKNRTKKYFC